MANIRKRASFNNVVAQKIMGSEDGFTMENRLFNIGCAVTLFILSIFSTINALTGFWDSFSLCAAAFICEAFFYYYARFKKQYERSIVANAVISYIIIIANYYVNSGVNGPTIFIFFLTFVLLLASTPPRMHFYWLITHILLGSGLIVLHISMPGIIKNSYPNVQERYVDMLLTVLTIFVFIYIVTGYLRYYYTKEKTKANQSQARLKAFFESSNTCYILLDTFARVNYFNKAAAQFIRDAYGSTLTEGIAIEVFIHPQYLAQFKANFANALSGIPCTEERVLVYEGTGQLWQQFSFLPVKDANNIVTAVSFSCIDVTKRREQSEKISDNNKALLKIAFLQSHELRQPVSSILGLLNLIKEDPQNKADYIEYLHDAVDELGLKLNKVTAETEMPAGGANIPDEN